jgi:hypothetical protein
MSQKVRFFPNARHRQDEAPNHASESEQQRANPLRASRNSQPQAQLKKELRRRLEPKTIIHQHHHPQPAGIARRTSCIPLCSSFPRERRSLHSLRRPRRIAGDLTVGELKVCHRAFALGCHQRHRDNHALLRPAHRVALPVPSSFESFSPLRLS